MLVVLCGRGVVRYVCIVVNYIRVNGRAFSHKRNAADGSARASVQSLRRSVIG